MGVFSRLLLNDGPNNLQIGLLSVLGIILAVIAVVLVPFAIYLVFRMAQAENGEKRKAAKKRIVNVVVSLILIGILAGAMMIPEMGAAEGPLGEGGFQMTVRPRAIAEDGTPARVQVFRGPLDITSRHRLDVTMESGPYDEGENPDFFATLEGSGNNWIISGNRQGEVYLVVRVYDGNRLVGSLRQYVVIMPLGGIDGGGPGNGGGGGIGGMPTPPGDGRLAFPIRMVRQGETAVIPPNSHKPFGANSTSSFGRPNGGGRHHMGVDLQNTNGRGFRQAVFAIAEGDVVQRAIGHNGGAGNLVTIRHSPNLYSRYIHLDSIMSNVQNGGRVQRGQQIGNMGITGSVQSWGHLHFEMGTSIAMWPGDTNFDPFGPAYINRFFDISTFGPVPASYECGYGDYHDCGEDTHELRQLFLNHSGQICCFHLDFTRNYHHTHDVCNDKCDEDKPSTIMHDFFEEPEQMHRITLDRPRRVDFEKFDVYTQILPEFMYAEVV
ncbi:MAG: peptidoglycan DD-metalloendopeptidase family protein [Firmicutes bacterium]|nr:peptidoglycan DD-metalloendopeptidase family protein [Bacillota bacterium]